MEFKKKVWLIMDKKRGIIAKGIPRNRYLIRVDDEKDHKRFLTYNSKGMAEAGFHGSWFYDGPGVNDYFKEQYGTYREYVNGNWIDHGPEEQDCMEAVEAEIIVKI